MKAIRGILWGAAIAPLLALLFLGGCATRSEVQRFQWQVDSLSLINQIQSRQLMRIDSLMAENIRLLRVVQATQGADMSALQDEMRIVESIMRDSGFKVNNLTDRIESLKDDIGNRPPDETDSLDPQKPRGDEIFSTALIDLNQGKFDLASMGFESYLENFPDGSRADDSRYNIGEVQLAKGEYAEAAMSYLTVTRKWPKSELIPSALYKAARCYEKMDQADMAKNYYKQLIERHSGVAEAELAKKRMKELER